MQFHAPPVSADRGGPVRGGRGAASSSMRRLEADDGAVPQPGRLLAIKHQAHNLLMLQQHGSPVSRSENNQHAMKYFTGVEGNVANASARKAAVHRMNVAPQPVNYLRLRRTEESAAAIARNRHAVVVQEILQPSSPTKQPPPNILVESDTGAEETRHRVDEKSRRHVRGNISIAIREQTDALAQMDRVLEEMGRRVFADKPSHTSESAVLALQLQTLYREQAQVERQSHAASQRVQELLSVVRSDISLMYKFTPLFKIYSRHKVKSAWHYWIQYVMWHRAEMARLALLWPHAVQIQRVFRRKRGQWVRARTRLELAWTQWQSAICIQRKMRWWLSSRDRQRHEEARHATKLQAGWRGRRDRRHVKKMLQEQLRWMLRSMTPTGNLHRLHEVVRRNPELAQPLNAMLSLIEETTVTVDADSVYKAKNLRIAARIAARPIEATRSQLYHAIVELTALIAEREYLKQEAKREYVRDQEEKQKRLQQRDSAFKERQLQPVREKIAADKETALMLREELETREHLRMLKTVDADRVLHIKLDQKRRQEAENAQMVVEEYKTRYVYSEVRRRQLDDEKRQREILKRHLFLQDQEREQTNQLLQILKTDEMKRSEVQVKREIERQQEHELWSHLSKEQQAEALRRLALKQQLEDEEKRRMDAIVLAREEQHQAIMRRREESRRRKQEELELELRTRECMDQEEKLSKRVHFEMKRTQQAQLWQSKREKEVIKYSLDPMHFAKVQALKELEEKERRERVLMRMEEVAMNKIHDHERKERYFQECRRRKKLQQEDAIRAHKESVIMAIEDQLERERLAVIHKAEEQKLLLARMSALAEQDKLSKLQRLAEARSRKLMHEEELRQRRIAQSIQTLSEVRERHERQSMTNEDRSSRAYHTWLAKKEDKRLREKRILRMMKEDVASMERQDCEEEGARLEQLLWSQSEAAAFRHLVSIHGHLLQTNVRLLKEICSLSGLPPYDLDYEAVHRHRRAESTMSPDKVPRKRRKPRKFFYHEFFEDDPILSKTRPPPPPTASRARQRWKKLAEHFFGTTWSSDSVRKGYLLMSEHKYVEASVALLEAVRIGEASSGKTVSVALIRQLARCYLHQWESNFQHNWLEKSLFYFQKVSAHIALLTSPLFLQEIAFVLEKAGKYREAAEVIAGIISCFPRYAKINEVIFRGGVIMLSLQMYQQSREYFLHLLEELPSGWEAFDILFLVARIMQFEGKARRKMCSVAYEEAFRTNKRDAFYRIHPTWKEWIKSSDTWRLVGDRYFAKNEFVLARDAFHVMMKRQFKKPKHLMTKRQLAYNVRASIHISAYTAKRGPSDPMDDEDWLRLARCAAILNDRPAAQSALHSWFAIRSYEDRVLERFHAWPLARWKLLGVDVPQKVIEALAEKRSLAEATEAAKRRDVEAKRQLVLRQRSLKARGVLAAWQDESSKGTSTRETEPPVWGFAVAQDGETDASAHVMAHDHSIAEPQQNSPWMKKEDESSHEVYYLDELTSEVAWDPPS